MGADLLDRLRSQLDWTPDPQQPGVSTQLGSDPERRPPPEPDARPASALLGGMASGLGANVDVRGKGFQSPPRELAAKGRIVRPLWTRY